MVDFPRVPGGSTKFPHGTFVGPPKTLSSREIADLFADLGKLVRRDRAATALITALRLRLDGMRKTAHEAEQVIASVCSFLATIEGAEAKDQFDALLAVGDKLREEARRPECVDVPVDPLAG